MKRFEASLGKPHTAGVGCNSFSSPSIFFAFFRYPFIPVDKWIKLPAFTVLIFEIESVSTKGFNCD